MRLGVLITYHNERELLTECLASLMSQSRPPDEILIYDDASRFPAEAYLGGAPARVVRGETNQGPAVGRNRLLEEATADYIHFHDADDLFLPGWGQAIARAAELQAPDFILTEINSRRDDGTYSERLIQLRKLSRQSDLVLFTLEHPVLPAAGTYRRSFVQRAGGYREDLWQSEDYEFHVRLAGRGAKYCAIYEPLVLLRVRNESRSQRQLEVWECRLKGLEILTKSLSPHYRAALAEAYAVVGRQLHALGARSAARRSFSLAKSLGGAQFMGASCLYRWVVTWFGPNFAERIGDFYRRLLPAGLRRLFHGA